MIYAITNVSTGAFEGFYDSSYADMEPTVHFIEIDETKRDDLLADSKQYWDGSAWQELALSLDERKEKKIQDLNMDYAAAHLVDWTQSADSGSGWVTRLERVMLLMTATTITTGFIYLFGRRVDFTDVNDIKSLMADIELYEYNLDNWYRDKLIELQDAADDTALDAIVLLDGLPETIELDLEF